MPSNMRQFFSKPKGSYTQSPDLGASASATCACGCLIHGQWADNITMPVPEPAPAPAPPATPWAAPAPAPVPTPFSTPPVPAASSLAAPTPIKGTEPHKFHSTRDNLLNGTSITLSILAGIGAVAPVPFLKDVAEVTKSLVDYIQTILQNDELSRELIQDAIGLGRCIIDAINACFTAGEPLPEVFEQHVRLLLDTLVEVKYLCIDILKESQAKKTFNVKPNKDKIEAYRRRIKGGLDFFQASSSSELRSNISVEAHFAKLTKFLEDKFPLNGFTPQPDRVQNISNINNSRTHITNAPVNMHTFTCSGNGIQAGLGNQMNVIGMDPSAGGAIDALGLQKMILENITHLRPLVPARK